MAETGAADDIGAINVPPGLTWLERLKAIAGGSAGNLVEWYDWFAYTSFSLYFASSFFPKGDETAQLLQAAVVNIISFGARPIGAWIMGNFADRFGRKKALIIAVLMMAFGSLIMAFAPTYAQLGGAEGMGWMAAVIVGGARLIQGLSVGGQYGAAATYLSEMAPAGKRGFWSSFHYVTLIGGQLLAVIILMILQKVYPEQAIKDGAWRIAFYIGAGLALVVFFIQAFLHETQSFKSIKDRAPFSIKHAGAVVLFIVLTLAAYLFYITGGKSSQTLWVTFGLLALTAITLLAPLTTKFPRQALAIMGLTIAGTSGFYAYTTYMLKFLQAAHAPATVAAFTKPIATNINFWCLMVFMLAQPLFGWLADKFGRKTMLLISFGLGAVVAYPIYNALAGTTDFVTAIALCCVPLILLSAYTSISAIVKAELFPAHLRALGVALPYSVANAVAGGALEPLALYWKGQHVENYFYFYVVGVMVIGFIATAFLLHETNKSSLIVED